MLSKLYILYTAYELRKDQIIYHYENGKKWEDERFLHINELNNNINERHPS